MIPVSLLPGAKQEQGPLVATTRRDRRTAGRERPTTTKSDGGWIEGSPLAFFRRHIVAARTAQVLLAGVGAATLTGCGDISASSAGAVGGPAASANLEDPGIWAADIPYEVSPGTIHEHAHIAFINAAAYVNSRPQPHPGRGDHRVTAAQLASHFLLESSGGTDEEIQPGVVKPTGELGPMQITAKTWPDYAPAEWGHDRADDIRYAALVAALLLEDRGPDGYNRGDSDYMRRLAVKAALVPADFEREVAAAPAVAEAPAAAPAAGPLSLTLTQFDCVNSGADLAVAIRASLPDGSSFDVAATNMVIKGGDGAVMYEGGFRPGAQKGGPIAPGDIRVDASVTLTDGTTANAGANLECL